MKVRQVRRQSELAGQLLSRLERMVGLRGKLPSEGKVLAVVDIAERLAKSMKSGTPIAGNPEKAAEAEVILP